MHAKHGQLSHICEICGKPFEWKSSYRRHLKNVHKDDNPDETVNNWMNASTLRNVHLRTLQILISFVFYI